MKEREERMAELRAHYETIKGFAEKDALETDFVLALSIYAMKRWGCHERTGIDYAKAVLMQAGVPFEEIENHVLKVHNYGNLFKGPSRRVVSVPRLEESLAP